MDTLVHVLSHETRESGVKVYRVRVRDGYDGLRYALERGSSRFFAERLDRYLKKRPHVSHEHPHNLARKTLYAIPAFREWSQFMPDSLALEPIYHPELRRLHSGGRIDPLTRRLFRHGYDPVGIRTRTVTGAWIVRRSLPEHPKRLRWLSLAGGTLRPTLLMLSGTGTVPSAWEITNVERDIEALKLAKEAATMQGIPASQVKLLKADVTDEAAMYAGLQNDTYDVVEMMGLFEYLSDEQISQVLKTSYVLLRPGGIIIFGNMRRKHPQLDLHKRGVGWPGVRPRSVGMVAKVLVAAGIPATNVEVYQPTDNVYNIFRIIKQ
jgi:SAM-dependent methyltransferase